jgi:hypothetical protein
MNLFLLFTTRILVGCFIILCSTTLLAQPNIEWQKCLGGSGVDEGLQVKATTDGGYIVTGKTLSNDGDVSGNHGVSDFWVVKLDSIGAIEWQKTYGGSNHDRSYSIDQTTDGGYVVAGHTASNNGDVSGNHGDLDCWVLKLSSSGAIEWQKTLGGSDWDEAWSVRQTTDGGYIVAGRTRSNDGDVSGNHGAFDFWVTKLDNLGTIVWQKCLGGSLDDIGYSVRQSMDGGYIVTGETASLNGDVTGLHGSTDYWVVKLDPAGGLEWQKTLGSSSLDRPNDIYPTHDGGYVVVGIASWNDGNVTGNHGGFDYWVVKLDELGKIQWQKSLGGSDQDFAQSVQQTNDGGYIIAGFTRSEDGDVLDNDGGQDIWVVQLTPEGEIRWQKALGGTQGESAYSIHQALDNGFILVGFTQSNNGDVSGFHGTQDYWVVKLSPESVNTEESSTPLESVEIYPNPATQSVLLKIPSEETTLQVRVIDLVGRETIRQTISKDDALGVSFLPKGVYLVVVTTRAGKVYTGKLQKE